mmetsp:Transcript_1863/g.4826  ORF Transcript_1863/g.4826 Transcript_1863/m.4826 type:complete len:207 (-) Transcript_1863:802-1422(-)
MASWRRSCCREAPRTCLLAPPPLCWWRTRPPWMRSSHSQPLTRAPSLQRLLRLPPPHQPPQLRPSLPLHPQHQQQRPGPQPHLQRQVSALRLRHTPRSWPLRRACRCQALLAQAPRGAWWQLTCSRRWHRARPPLRVPLPPPLPPRRAPRTWTSRTRRSAASPRSACSSPRPRCPTTTCPWRWRWTACWRTARTPTRRAPRRPRSA